MSADPALNINSDFSRALVRCNRDLDDAAAFFKIDERFLIGQYLDLEDLVRVDERVYWLTLARLTELALFCAGNYVDMGELRSAGDLFINPRRVLVHVRHESLPRLKKRHMMLTRQFRSMAESKGGVIEWLKRETVVEVKERALLPEFFERLSGSGYLAADYLDDLDRRLKKMAEAIGLVSSALVRPPHDFHEYLGSLPPGDLEFMESQLCRFDLNLFNEMGRDLNDLLLIPGFGTRFLVPVF